MARETGKDSIRELEPVGAVPCLPTILQKQKDDIKRQEGEAARNAGGEPADRTAAPKIGQLKEKLGWEERQVRAPSHRMYRVDAVEWLTYYQCQGLIGAMKAILERKPEKEGMAGDEG